MCQCLIFIATRVGAFGKTSDLRKLVSALQLTDSQGREVATAREVFLNKVDAELFQRWETKVRPMKFMSEHKNAMTGLETANSEIKSVIVFAQSTLKSVLFDFEIVERGHAVYD